MEVSVEGHKAREGRRRADGRNPPSPRGAQIFGGTRPEDMPTLAADWKLATEARRLSTARSATESSPVVLDPITAGIPPSYKPEPFGGDDEDD